MTLTGPHSSNAHIQEHSSTSSSGAGALREEGTPTATPGDTNQQGTTRAQGISSAVLSSRGVAIPSAVVNTNAVAIAGAALHPRLEDFWRAVFGMYQPTSLRLELATPSDAAALCIAQEMGIRYLLAGKAHTVAHGWPEEYWGLAAGAAGPVTVFSKPDDFRRWMLGGTSLLVVVWDGKRYGPVWDLVWLAQAQGVRVVNLARALKEQN